MKRSLFLYLFILVVLTNLFTYVYLSKEVEFEQSRFQKLDIKMRDTIDRLLVKNADADYFSLENSQNAQDYFENKATGKFIPYDKLIPMVKDKLLDLNANPNG